MYHCSFNDILAHQIFSSLEHLKATFKKIISGIFQLIKDNSCERTKRRGMYNTSYDNLKIILRVFSSDFVLKNGRFLLVFELTGLLIVAYV